MNTHLHRPKLTLATKVTIVRIMGVPVFIVLLIYYLIGLVRGEDIWLERILALVVFTAVALTDALDGYLARSRNEVTDLGRMLDPIADKALLLSGLILLTRPSLPALAPHIPIWFTALVISRDVVLILGSTLVHALAGAVRVHPRFSGKLATVFQMATIMWVLIGGAERQFNWFLGAAAVLTALSWIQYVVDGARQLAHVQHGPQK
ncbi:MAG: CDP-alcohol phosphatidyltransferase family protein [Verrucomicrobia bacterium]|nr:MAG: CDP-alcohol phosphatidyltransferase family protein [Verrucomicrobiota bacterium]